MFTPYNVSIEVANAIAENAAQIGASDPFEQAVFGN
jgi:hypothetical protein